LTALDSRKAKRSNGVHRGSSATHPRKGTESQKYVFLYNGYDASTPDIEQKWHDWFALRADSFADPGNPFGPGRTITADLTKGDMDGIPGASGYSVVNAASLGDAEALLEGCRIVDTFTVDPSRRVNGSSRALRKLRCRSHEDG